MIDTYVEHGDDISSVTRAKQMCLQFDIEKPCNRSFQMTETCNSSFGRQKSVTPVLDDRQSAFAHEDWKCRKIEDITGIQ